MKYLALLGSLCVCAFAQDGPVVSVSGGPDPRPWTTQYYYDASDNLEYVCMAKPSRATTPAWSTSATTLTSVVDSTNTATVTTSSAHGLTQGQSVTFTGTTYSIAAATLTNIVVTSNSGVATTVADHGLVIGDYVTVSGATVDTDLNAEYAITSKTDKTITFTTSSVADATYVDATLQFVTCDDELLDTFEILTVPSTTTFTFTSANLTDATYNEVGLSMSAGTLLLDTSAVWSVRRYVYDASGNLIATWWADGNTVDDNICANRATLSWK